MATTTKSPAKRPVTPAKPTAKPSTTSLRDSGAVVERTTGDQIALGPQADEVEEVTVIVPKAFTLNRDDGTSRRFEIGVQEARVDDSAHWFSRANGLKVYTPKK